MKLNKKGFMLAEVVVSASVIAVILVTLYIGLNRMTSAYETRNRYYDIDAQQVAMEVNNALNRNGNPIFDKYIKLSEANGEFKSDVSALCKLYTDELDITVNNVYIVDGSPGFESLKNSITDESNESFKDYLDYIINKIDFDENYSYFIVVELERNSEYYYYTLRVK